MKYIFGTIKRFEIIKIKEFIIVTFNLNYKTVITDQLINY